jgi:hypothetical protein
MRALHVPAAGAQPQLPSCPPQVASGTVIVIKISD